LETTVLARLPEVPALFLLLVMNTGTFTTLRASEKDGTHWHVLNFRFFIQVCQWPHSTSACVLRTNASPAVLDEHET
jgi:hypothetical protein